MEQTRSALGLKIETLQRQIAAGANNTTHEATQAMKDCCEVGEKFERHPWWFFGGAVALGFFLARMLWKKHGHEAAPQPSWRDESSDFMRKSDEAAGDSANESPAAVFGEKPSEPESPLPQPTAPVHEDRDHSEHHNKEHHEKSADLKSLLIGAGLGALRELAVKRAPEEMRQFLADVANAFTTKLGGEVIPSSAAAAKPSPAGTGPKAADAPKREDSAPNKEP